MTPQAFLRVEFERQWYVVSSRFIPEIFEHSRTGKRGREMTRAIAQLRRAKDRERALEIEREQQATFARMD